MRTRTPLAAICLICVLCSGCKLGGRDVEDLARPIKGQVLTDEHIAEAAEPDPGAAWSARRLAETKGSRLFAIQLAGDMRAYKLWFTDQVFFVVSGSAIASVDNKRRVVGPGSVVVVPRRKEVMFVRDEAHRGSPLLLTLAITPSRPLPEALAEALAPPSTAEQAEAENAEQRTSPGAGSAED